MDIYQEQIDKFVSYISPSHGRKNSDWIEKYAYTPKVCRVTGKLIWLKKFYDVKLYFAFTGKRVVEDHMTIDYDIGMIVQMML